MDITGLSKSQEEFLACFFGASRREALLTGEGFKYRILLCSHIDLINYLYECTWKNTPAYLSVQPYNARDQPSALEKFFFEFDCERNPYLAWKDAVMLAKTLKTYYDADSLLVFSGRKGYHVYVYLRDPIYFDSTQFELAKLAYKELQQRLLKGLDLKTLDIKVIGDLKRLARVPFSLHEKSGKMCQPVDLQGKPSVPDVTQLRERGLDPELLRPVLKHVKQLLKALEKTREVHPTRKIKGVRPCITEALKMPLEGGSGHLMRLACAIELLHTGLTVNEVASYFKNQADFSLEKTRRYIEHAQKRGYKPFRCETIRALGYCLGSSCPLKLKGGLLK